MRPLLSDRPAWQRYGFGLAVVIAALLGRKLIDPFTTDAMPLATLYAAVAFAVWFGGWRPAVFVMVTGYIAGLWWFYPPRQSLKLWAELGLVQSAVYALSCAAMIFLAESMRRARRRHAAAEQKLVALLEQMDEGFCSVDGALRFTYLNPAAEKYLGLSTAQAAGRPWREILPHLADSVFEQQLQALLRDRQPFRFDSDEIVPGHWTNVSALATTEGAAVFLRNVTAEKRERERLEDEVARRTAELRQTIADLESFSYILVHDMRAPLRSIRGYAELVSAEHAAEIPPLVAGHLAYIKLMAERMDRLIMDVLRYSRLTRLEPELQEIDLNDVVRDVVSHPTLLPATAEIHVDDDLPIVRGDKALLGQCVSNLVQNAAKFVAPGVKPRIRIHADTAGPVVRLNVTDNGIGIAPEARERIFEPFQREDANYDGTGIGLAIVRKVIERLHGHVGVESQPGAGSRFWIELPTAGSADSASPVNAAPIEVESPPAPRKAG